MMSNKGKHLCTRCRHYYAEDDIEDVMASAKGTYSIYICYNCLYDPEDDDDYDDEDDEDCGMDIFGDGEDQISYGSAMYRDLISND